MQAPHQDYPKVWMTAFSIRKESYLVRCISVVKFNEPHVMSLYGAFPISKVLGLIAAINPTMTAGNPGVRETREKIESVIFSYNSSLTLRRVLR